MFYSKSLVAKPTLVDLALDDLALDDLALDDLALARPLGEEISEASTWVK